MAVVALAAIGGWVWFQVQLSPVNRDDTSRVVVEIESGLSPTGIAAELKSKSVIRSETAFLWYTRFTGTQNQLQAGTYRLAPSESTQEIVQHLTNGSVDTFSITFLPGATLAQNRQVLIDAGYAVSEVDAALAATYESPLFEGKPADTDLEGYIYGETYQFGTGATVSEILEHTFEIYEQVINEHGLVEAYAKQGLSLYQGITLASIVQREAIGGDEAGIAQVFLKRLALGMPLGSDVTYQYIADKTGVERDINLDSPYNTRRYPGLPPGPIATPGERALIAVGSPAETDYLYFLSGDDNVTYFSRTFEEHEQNIVDHCQEKCQII
ncbi:MAG: endolytic transglycosylase MltG [Alphaproteobacteria bacterium]|nr:endolytic transglycosylase MltG [Alphaproteobacteria bacterium]